MTVLSNWFSVPDNRCAGPTVKLTLPLVLDRFSIVIPSHGRTLNVLDRSWYGTAWAGEPSRRVPVTTNRYSAGGVACGRSLGDNHETYASKSAVHNQR